jgi:hypothetical protein
MKIEVKKLGYLYYMFPVDISDEKEVIAIDNSWQWKYFEWVFYFLMYCMNFASEVMKIESQFLIYIPKKYR